MMKGLIAVLALVFVAAMPLMADTWTDPDTGYTWYYRINGDAAEIFNYGNVAVSPNPTGDLTIPDTLGGKAVTEIGECAFYDRKDYYYGG